MRVLLDHCVPKPWGRLLKGHFVRTAKWAGWEDLENGELLAAAAMQSDAMVSADQGFEFEHDPNALPIPVVVMIARSNRLEDLEPLSPQVQRLLGAPLQRRIYVVGLTSPD